MRRAAGVAGVAQAGGARALRVDRGHEQLLAELVGAGDHGAVVIDDHRVAVEDELVLAADEVAERHRGQGVAGALHQHVLPLAALARVVGRGREVDDHGGAGQRLVGQRRPGLPDVLADGQADDGVADLDEAAAGALLEVALLVEDAVVGQVGLAVDPADLAAGQYGGGVVDVLGPLGEADQGDDVVGLGRQPLDGGAGVGEEVLLEQQVLGRVAGNRQLGEHDELRALMAGARDVPLDLGHVPGDVADGGVDLGQGDAERGCHTTIMARGRRRARSSSWRRPAAAGRWAT